MKQYTKALAAVLALLLALAGCSGMDTSWVVQLGEDTIPPGVYLVEMMMGYNEAAEKLYGAEDIMKETIDDLPAAQYITNYAKTECSKLLAVRQEFNKRGLTLTTEDEEQAAAYTDYLYQMGETFYQANGVEKDAVQFINNTTMMSLEVFNSIYGAGGEKEVTREELENQFASQYTRSQYILFPKVDTTTGQPLSEEDIAVNQGKAEECFRKAIGGENFVDLLYDAAKEMTPGTAGEKMAENEYDAYLENNAGFYPPVYEETVLAAADGEIRMVADEYYFYIIKKLPVLEGDPERLQGYLDAILQNLKYDEYMETLEGWGKELEVKYNNAALAAFSAAKLKMTPEQIAGETGSESSSEAAESGSDSSSEAASNAG